MRKTEAQTQTPATERGKQATVIARCGRLAASLDLDQANALPQQDVTPETMTLRMIDLFGPGAVTAAAWCAFSAYCEADDVDYRFWLTVFTQLEDSV